MGLFGSISSSANHVSVQLSGTGNWVEIRNSDETITISPTGAENLARQLLVVAQLAKAARRSPASPKSNVLGLLMHD